MSPVESNLIRFNSIKSESARNSTQIHYKLNFYLGLTFRILPMWDSWNCWFESVKNLSILTFSMLIKLVEFLFLYYFFFLPERSLPFDYRFLFDFIIVNKLVIESLTKEKVVSNDSFKISLIVLAMGKQTSNLVFFLPFFQLSIMSMKFVTVTWCIYISSWLMNQMSRTRSNSSSAHLCNKLNFQFKFVSFGSWIKFNELISESNLELFSSCFGSLPTLNLNHNIKSTSQFIASKP